MTTAAEAVSGYGLYDMTTLGPKDISPLLPT